MQYYWHASVMKPTQYGLAGLCVSDIRRAHLVPFVRVGGKRLEDADCVSVRSSNLKIKTSVHHHIITHPISAPAQPFPQDMGRGVRGVRERGEHVQYETGAKIPLNSLLALHD